MKASPSNLPLDEKRGAGVLLHISSLPGAYGTGDLGDNAFQFVDFLQQAGQRYWQLLPLNPTEKDKGYSPYSSYSSIAGNTLLISPDRLVTQGLLTSDEVTPYQVRSSEKADFENAASIRRSLLELAYQRFKKSRGKKLKNQFDEFCRNEKAWLDDFALYTLLKEIHDGQPWYEWPEEFKERDRGSLRRLLRSESEALAKTRWLQFVFFQQWNDLRAYAGTKNIKLFGDLPFYVSYDSADVWAFPQFFSLDQKRKLLLVAGVPPDYFNEDGQLWGMPVFRWDQLKKNGYSWWATRLKKNVQMFDLLRLDHFRAFADHWAVPANQKTAKRGTWQNGPGPAFFSFIKRKLGTLPFVAEDLGDINEKVIALREEFAFPGMKVLHFAFSDNMAQSDYIPHNYSENYIVYTGTHDNNTTHGWYRKDLGEKERENVKTYLGAPSLSAKTVSDALIRLAYSSVARIAIVPAQDILGLDEKSRINAPATIEGNWLWRLMPDQLTVDHAKRLKVLADTFNR